jgi:hydroxyacylglutathione hydrolase
MIEVVQWEVGPMKNFVYGLVDPESRECFLVDPAWDIPLLLNRIDSQDWILKGVLITHYHPDHCGGHLWNNDIPGATDVVGKRPVPVYVNSYDVEGVIKVTGLSRTDIRPTEGGTELLLGKKPVTLIHTPGHTPGSQCFMCSEKLISGDTLFLSGCGRVDLPGGNADQLYYSITQTLAKLPSETVVYPGHNYDKKPFETMGSMMSMNPFLAAKTMEEWRRLN